MIQFFTTQFEQGRAALGMLAASAAGCSSQSGTSQTLCNPVQFSGMSEFIAGFLRAVVMISLPILTLFIVYSGFMFVMARGNEGKLKTAKQNFMFVILGAILILGAWTLATMIGATVSQVVGSS